MIYRTFNLINKNGELIYGKEPKAINLGLPNGLLWCDRNIGAMSPFDYGDYYAWGEIEPYYTVDWDNQIFNGKEYDFYPDGQYKFKVDNQGNEIGELRYDPSTLKLLDENDVCKQELGGQWRMPTDEEMNELIKNTDNKWVENYEGSGVNGYIFKEKEKENGNTIFLPAVGYFNDKSRYDTGSGGYYWSSVRSSDATSAYYLYFNSSDRLVSKLDRYDGYAVRAVCGS